MFFSVCIQAFIECEQFSAFSIRIQQFFVGIHLLMNLRQSKSCFVLVALHVLLGDAEDVLHGAHPISVQRSVGGRQSLYTLKPVILDVHCLSLYLANLQHCEEAQEEAQRSDASKA
ncbi:hypothetical protein D3C72_1185210 [compost metagenome]